MFCWRASLALALFLAWPAASQPGTAASHDKVVMCYWGTWANYRPKRGKFVTENVDGDLCTHLIYR